MNSHSYEGIDAKTSAALESTADDIRAHSHAKLTEHETGTDLIKAMADTMLKDYDAALQAGRDQVTMIVPVGPVGQYDMVAEACLEEGRSLNKLTLIIMDEYLTLEGAWISAQHPLSFRAHVQTHLLDRLPEENRPAMIVPDPRKPDEIGQIIERNGGLDISYAGVGVTGHLAFNEPIPGARDPDWFAGQATRVVSLLPETRLINSVTAAKGNVQMIPHLAVTVGMKEILCAGKLRIWMNRDWQCAAIRRMLFGPISAEFPASLVQRHPDVTLDVTSNVLAMPQPGLA